MDINAVLEDAQFFTYDLLRVYGYPYHELVEQWRVANTQWEITFHRMNHSIGLMDKLEKSLSGKLTESEQKSLEDVREGLRRILRAFTAFYQDAEDFSVLNLQYSTWLHQVLVKPKAEALQINKLSVRDPWWESQMTLSRTVSHKLREILVADDHRVARFEALECLRLMQSNILNRSIEVNPDGTIPIPEGVATLAELASKLDALEVDHMFFD